MFCHHLAGITEGWLNEKVYPSELYGRIRDDFLKPDFVQDAFYHETYRSANTLALLEALELHPRMKDLMRARLDQPLWESEKAIHRAVLDYDPATPLDGFITDLSRTTTEMDIERLKEQRGPMDVRRRGLLNFTAEGLTEHSRVARHTAARVVVTIYLMPGNKPIVQRLPVL